MHKSNFSGTPQKRHVASKKSLVISIVIFIIIILLAIVASSNHYRRKAALNQSKIATTQYNTLLKSTAPLSFKKLLPVIHAIQLAKSALEEDTTQYIITSTQNDRDLKAKIDSMYTASKQTLFLPLLANRYEHAIAANLKNPQILYTFLTAYLMLSHPKDLNTQTLLTTILYTNPNINKAVFKTTLLDAVKPPFHGLSEQNALVTVARNRLAALPLEKQALIVLLNEHLKPKILLSHLHWFTPNALQVPFIYRETAFQKTVTVNIPAATNTVLFGNLTFGARQNTRINPNDLSKLIYNQYLTDYANYWGNVLNWLQIKPLQHFSDIKSLISNFANPSSELTQVLSTLHKNSNLPQINYLNKKIAAFNNFYTDNRQTLSALQLRFKTESALLRKISKTQFLKNTQQAISIQNYTRIPFHTTLPSPINTWLEEINAQYWKLSVKQVLMQINAIWKTKIYTYYMKNFHAHFPFAPTEFPDASLKKFTAFFSPNGILNQFIESNALHNFFNLKQKTWTPTTFPGFNSKNNSGIATLQALHNISKIFFGNQKTPQLHFTLTPTLLNNNIKQMLLNINGKLLIADQNNLNKNTDFNITLHENNNAIISLLDQNNQTLNIAKKGQWAWLRLLADNQVRSLGKNNYRINFKLGKLHAQYTLKTGSAINPYPLPTLQHATPKNTLFN